MFKTLIQVIKEAREEIVGDKSNSYLLFDFICGMFGIVMLAFGIISGNIGLIIAGACCMASPVLLPIIFATVIVFAYIIFLCVTFPVMAIIELIKYIGLKINSRHHKE